MVINDFPDLRRRSSTETRTATKLLKLSQVAFCSTCGAAGLKIKKRAFKEGKNRAAEKCQKQKIEIFGAAGRKKNEIE